MKHNTRSILFGLGIIVSFTSGAMVSKWIDEKKIAVAESRGLERFIQDAAYAHATGGWSNSELAALRALAKGRSIVANVQIVPKGERPIQFGSPIILRNVTIVMKSPALIADSGVVESK